MVRKIFIATVCLCSAFYSVIGLGQTVRQAVNHVLHHTRSIHIDDANFGVVVMSMKTGRILYRRNMDHLYTPASVQKLFTATAALEYLKPSYRFKTGFYTNGSVHQHVLDGNLYVRFSGDPSLKLTNLTQMMDELHSMGIRRISGHVYIDNFAFNKVPYPPGWIWDDLSYSYAAPMNAIILNRNKFALRFTPSKVVGVAPRLASSLPPGVASFVNGMKTTNHYSNDCPIAIYSNMDNQYRVKGCLNRHWGAQSRSLAVRDMVQYAQVEVADMLGSRGIHYNGAITLKKTPNHPIPLVVHASKPLSHVIRHMLKRSDNLYTNALFKTLGEKYYGQRGSWQNGLQAVEHILSAPAGINFKHNLLTDGAGLSRYNLISPHQLVKLLHFVYRSPHIKPALYAALPIAGWDGTLEGRMADEGRSKRIHAKTGSMTGVSALSGYIITRHHGTLAFAIMANDFVGGLGPYVHLEDRICEALVRA